LKKTFLINDLFWIGLAVSVCAGSIKLGLGSWQQPHAGFMPFLSALVLGALALIDLLRGLINQWKDERLDREIWANINWPKLWQTIAILFVYVILFSTLGFIFGTILLLLFLFRLMEPRPFGQVIFASLITTGLFYLVFKIGLESQLPRGVLGF